MFLRERTGSPSSVRSRNSNGMKWRGLGFAQAPFSNGLLRSRNSAYNLAFTKL
jgi:hypothetical protein